jgi:hypothetical protein
VPLKELNLYFVRNVDFAFPRPPPQVLCRLSNKAARERRLKIIRRNFFYDLISSIEAAKSARETGTLCLFSGNSPEFPGKSRFSLEIFSLP